MTWKRNLAAAGIPVGVRRAGSGALSTTHSCCGFSLYFFEGLKILICFISVVQVPFSGPLGIVPELLFKKNGLIPDLQQLLIITCE
jgi:hypothetical protein